MWNETLLSHYNYLGIKILSFYTKRIAWVCVDTTLWRTTFLQKTTQFQAYFRLHTYLCKEKVNYQYWHSIFTLLRSKYFPFTRGCKYFIQILHHTFNSQYIFLLIYENGTQNVFGYNVSTWQGCIKRQNGIITILCWRVR